MRGKLYYKPIKLKRSLSMRVEELVSEYLINGYDVIVDNDNELDTKEEWKEKHMKDWVNNGWAMEVKVEDVSDLDEGEPVRARNDKGHYVADDPSTPDVNEAWEGGVAPEEKKETKKKTTKKTTAKKSTKKATK